jgi:formylglycine-generating enzyme required for sulfatase activity
MNRRLFLPTVAILAAAVAISCAPPPSDRFGEQPPMILIPSGTYTIGYDAGPTNESPSHAVEVGAFYIDKYEVTNKMYKVFLDKSGHAPPLRWRPDSTYWEQDADLPVTWITWHDASQYAEWRGCRLPTEAEWEVAARCTTAFQYPWGDSLALESGTSTANVKGDDDGHGLSPAPVGSFPDGQSCWGADDMAGNVWEWIADWYLPAAYQSRPPVGPMVTTTDSLFRQRVIRGGSWFDGAEYARTTARAGFDPSYGSDIIGFRCARDAGDIALGR